MSLINRLFPILILNIIKYPLNISYSHSIIGHRDILFLGFCHTVHHELPVEHAGAAMDNQIVTFKIFWKVVS